MEDISKGIINQVEKEMEASIAFLDEDLKTYRAGKASSSVFNGVMVNYYGSPTPLSQVSSITTPDAKSIMIQPWEKNLIPTIEKAIIDANLAFTPQNNGESIRINIPPLTEERRKDLVKKVKAAGETAKISLRNARRDGIESLKKAQKEGLAEDIVKSSEEEIQKITDKYNKKIDSLVSAKEQEIMTV